MAIDTQKIKMLLRLPADDDVQRQLGKCLENVEISDIGALEELLSEAKGAAKDLISKLIVWLKKLLAENDFMPSRWVWHPKAYRNTLPRRHEEGHWTRE